MSSNRRRKKSELEMRQMETKANMFSTGRRHISLKEYAGFYGISYITAWRQYRAGLIPGAYKVGGDKGDIRVPTDYVVSYVPKKVTIYVAQDKRHKTAEKDMKKAVEKVTEWCLKHDLIIQNTIEEYYDDTYAIRPKLMKLLGDRNVKHIVIDRKASVSVLGFDYISYLLRLDEREIGTIKSKEEVDEDVRKKELLELITELCVGWSRFKIGSEDVRAAMQDLGVIKKRARGEYVTKDIVKRLRRREELKLEKQSQKNAAKRKREAVKKIKEEFKDKNIEEN